MLEIINRYSSATYYKRLLGDGNRCFPWTLAFNISYECKILQALSLMWFPRKFNRFFLIRIRCVLFVTIFPNIWKLLTINGILSNIL